MGRHLLTLNNSGYWQLQEVKFRYPPESGY